MFSLSKIILPLTLVGGFATAHYANMAIEGVSCYIYNGIKGTPDGHMIVRNANGTWFDHDDKANYGYITVVHAQREYDQLPVKTKIGIVCAPDDVTSTNIGIPYAEMEPSDADFYAGEQTVYTRAVGERGIKAVVICVMLFCSDDPK